MKKNILLHSALTFLILFTFQSCFAQNKVNWRPDQLMAPAILAKAIKENKNIPVIINIGPAALIPNSVDAGATGNVLNLQKLKKELSKSKPNTAIVLYCGCCPYEHCPNVRPAMEALKQMKFTNYYLLDLPSNIRTDWISKGYPIVD